MKPDTMKQATHTPGPWTYDDAWSLIIGPQGQEVAALHSAQAPDDAKRANRNTVSANARLIAAAPKLLAALKAVAPLMAALGDSDLWSEIHDDTYIAIREAIAAATGKGEA